MPIPAPGNVDSASQTTLLLVKAKTDNLPATPANEATLTAQQATLLGILGSSRLAVVNSSFTRASAGSQSATITPPGAEVWQIEVIMSVSGLGTISAMIKDTNGSGVAIESPSPTIGCCGVMTPLIVTNANPLVLTGASSNAGGFVAKYQYFGVKL